MEESLRLNISGTIYHLPQKLGVGSKITCGKSLLKRFLGAPSHDERVRLADSYDESENSYIFQRNAQVFEAVLSFYRTGKLRPITDICPQEYFDELNFWKINFSEFANLDCAKPRRFNAPQKTIQLDDEKSELLPSKGGRDYSTIQQEIVHELEHHHHHAFVGVCWGEMRHFLWKILDEPTSSRAAQIFTIISTGFIVISIVGMTLASMPHFQDDRGMPHTGLEITEIVCITWFTLEFFARFFVIHSKWRFFKKPMTVIDFASIVPAWLELCLHVSGFDIASMREVKGPLLAILSQFALLLKILRVARVLKLARYSRVFQSFLSSLGDSSHEIRMLTLIMGIAIICFATAVYFFEKDIPDSKFTSIPACFWWCASTMTTVGYKDMVPQTMGGKIVGAIAAVSGLVVLSFPVMVIVQNFSKEYTQPVTTLYAIEHEGDEEDYEYEQYHYALYHVHHKHYHNIFSLHRQKSIEDVEIEKDENSALSLQSGEAPKSRWKHAANLYKKSNLKRGGICVEAEIVQTSPIDNERDTSKNRWQRAVSLYRKIDQSSSSSSNFLPSVQYDEERRKRYDLIKEVRRRSKEDAEIREAFAKRRNSRSKRRDSLPLYKLKHNMAERRESLPVAASVASSILDQRGKRSISDWDFKSHKTKLSDSDSEAAKKFALRWRAKKSSRASECDHLPRISECEPSSSTQGFVHVERVNEVKISIV